MAAQTKTRLTNGTALTCGSLTILVKDRDPGMVKTLLDYMISYDDENPVTPENKAKCEQEIQRLQDLMERIVNGYPDNLDIFQYLPLTKAGKFNNAQNTLIADSGCTTAGLFSGGRSMYLEKQTVQLRLMPYYDSADAFIRNQKMEDVRELRLDWYDSVRKTVPVFDFNGSPAKPETARASYLKDTDIRPGFVYEEKSGTQFLALEGMQFGARYIFQWPGKDPEPSEVLWYGQTDHIYIRWTKKLESALAGASDFNTFSHIMADSIKSDPWPFKGCVSIRENPRKFTKEIRQVLDPSLTKPEQFTTAPSLSPAVGQDRKMWFEYFLFQDNRIPEDMLTSKEYNRDTRPL